jgi:D-amino peptidase
MKVYISADLEGVTGVTHFDEVDKRHTDYTEYREQMTAEVSAACEGAQAAGATEIFVKDAHATGRNLIHSKLPQSVKLIRGWSEHPFSMVDGLDESFDALLMVGYHARAGAGADPLAHTITGRLVWVKVNDQLASEFVLHAYAAGLMQVPVVFLSGDEGVCQDAQKLIPTIKTVAVKSGVGRSTISMHPAHVLSVIRQAVKAALESDLSTCQVTLPKNFAVEVRFKEHPRAYRASFYPAAELIDPHTIRFRTEDYFEVLRLLTFVL